MVFIVFSAPAEPRIAILPRVQIDPEFGPLIFKTLHMCPKEEPKMETCSDNEREARTESRPT